MDVEPLDVWTPPEVLTAREVCEIELPEGQEVLGPLVMVGSRLVIGGRSGEGKTTFVMGMARAVSRGEELLGWKGCGGRVLVLDLEQGLRTVQRALGDAGLQAAENVDYVRVPDGLALDRDETQAAWLRSLLIERSYAMVVLDPLYKAHQGDSNDERAMVDMMRRLDRWRDELGFALVIPMHLRKMDQGNNRPTMDDIYGSGGLTRGAEVVVGIVRTVPGKAKLHFWKDRDGDLSQQVEWNLVFSRERGFERDPEERRAPPHVAIANAFLAHGGGALGISDLVDATGYSDRPIRDTVKAMVRRGELVEGKPGAHGRAMYALERIPDEVPIDRWEEMADG